MCATAGPVENMKGGGGEGEETWEERMGEGGKSE